MAHKVYNKLVRDNIPEVIEADGLIPKTRLLGAVAHLAAIREKYPEEFQELDEAIIEGNDEHILLELVDLQELLDAETTLRGFTLAQRHRAQMKKREERGGFEQGIFLESVIEPEEQVLDSRRITLATYDNSAPALAEYFRGIGSRVEDIERAIELHGGTNLSVLELGSGDGRDGVAIAERVAQYKGLDYSAGMVAIAQQTSPDIDFEVADMLTAEFPPNQDIIFAFASLLHLDKNDVKTVLDKCFASLNESGILYISTKYKPEYTAEWKQDKFGNRLFYFYSPDELLAMVDSDFQEVYRDAQTIGDTDWFTQAFQKKTTGSPTRENWSELE